MSPQPPEVKRLNIHVPRGEHDAFKAATASEGKQMTDVLLEFIRSYIAEHQPRNRRRGGAR